LAKVATQEKFTAVAERGWRKIYAANRQDPDAARELGLLLFANRHYSEAQQVLVQARQNDPNDYRVNMAYGEILQQQRKKREAQSYFRQAITQVSENTNKDDWQEQDRARLLYRSNRINESIALFRDLLEKNPDNKSLRAELAGILIEQKQYQDANRLLAAP
jgi:Flp pilus assembly protein TadD